MNIDPLASSPSTSAPSVFLPEWARRLAVFDTETTGVDTRRARIVSAHVGVMDESGHEEHGRSWLIDPGVEIPWQAQRVHGISTDRARSEGLTAAEGIAEIDAAVRAVLDQGIPLVVYNAPYDLAILDAERERYGLQRVLNPSPIVDPLIIDKAVDTYRKGKRTLTAACAHYQVKFEDAHHAAADAIAAGRLAQAIARTHADSLSISAQELHTAQIGWARDQADSFTAYMRRKGNADFHASGAWPVA